MSPVPHKNFQERHTLVLPPRSFNESQPLVIGSKQQHLHYARGSPPLIRSSMPARSLSTPVSPLYRPPKNTLLNEGQGSDLLVRFGIDSALGRMVTQLLIALIFFQPMYIAFGMEIEEATEATLMQNETGTPVTDESTIDVEAHIKTEEVNDNHNDFNEEDDIETVVAATEEKVSPETSSVSNGGEPTQMITDDGGEDIGDESEVSVIETTEENMTDSVGDSSGYMEEVDTKDNENVGEEPVESNEEDLADSRNDVDVKDGGASEEDEAKEDEVSGNTPLEDRADERAEETDQVAIVNQNPANKYVFGEGDCTLVSEGEFYCIAKGPERQRQSGDRKVYAEKDREGDREIYYFDGVSVQRITNNNYDDFAPVFDEETMRIVWQAMINDRLQIMLHELSTNVTRQITTTRDNSSNPSIAGDIVVWQEWVDTNWEVMMVNVNNNGQPFEIVRLTDNVVHDMFPVAYDGMVTWQSERGSVWEVVLYDITTGKKHSLEKNDTTARYVNPRFVLLFDSKHENGDVETIGYDLHTGDMMELGTRANPQPVVPVTPKDETPEAVVREATESSDVEVETDDDTDDSDDMFDTHIDSALEKSVETSPHTTTVTAEGTVVLE